MSNNNAPFHVGQRVVAINSSTAGFSFVYKKGDIKIVAKMRLSPISCEWDMYLKDSGDFAVRCANFAPIDEQPYSESVTAELAKKAMEVGDKADSKVREIVNN